MDALGAETAGEGAEIADGGGHSEPPGRSQTFESVRTSLSLAKTYESRSGLK